MVKEKIRADLKRYIHRHAERRPMIMPVIMEICFVSGKLFPADSVSDGWPWI